MFHCKSLVDQYIIGTFAQNISIDIICNMKYNIDKVVDFLAELTGSEVRMFAHEKRMIVNLL